MIRVAIVGAGPSGLFTMVELLTRFENISIDIYDKLPTPYGLLRTGVAPDHQKIKYLQTYYEKIILKHKDQIRFYGDIDVGFDIQIKDIKHFYTSIFICTGSESDKKISIPGENLPNVIPSRLMVRWYNSHPDYSHLKHDFSGKTMSIIGLGNVSLDIARLFIKNTTELAQTDMSPSVIKQLGNNNISTIHLFGRRGPVQSAFTVNEFNECCTLDASVEISRKYCKLSQIDKLEIEKDSQARRNFEAIQRIAHQKPFLKSLKKLNFHYFMSPIEIKQNKRNLTIVFEKTTLVGEAGKQKAVGTGIFLEKKTDLCVTSIGYKGKRIPGLPFNEDSGTVPHEKGRVMNNNKVLTGLYVAGWIKRGAIGVVGTNKAGAKETVNSFVEDMSVIPKIKFVDHSIIEAVLQKYHCKWISYDDWLSINDFELTEGKKINKPRLKLEKNNDFFKYIDSLSKKNN